MVTSLQVAGALVAGDGRPKLAPAATLSKPGAIHKPDAKPNVLAVRADVAAPADRRMRLEIADVFAAYVAAYKARGAEVASADVFGAQDQGIHRGGRHSHTIERRQFFWCGVKLCGSA
jgi:hypothetical protein